MSLKPQHLRKISNPIDGWKTRCSSKWTDIVIMTDMMVLAEHVSSIVVGCVAFGFLYGT